MDEKIVDQCYVLYELESADLKNTPLWFDAMKELWFLLKTHDQLRTKIVFNRGLRRRQQMRGY